MYSLLIALLVLFLQKVTDCNPECFLEFRHTTRIVFVFDNSEMLMSKDVIHALSYHDDWFIQSVSYSHFIEYIRFLSVHSAMTSFALLMADHISVMMDVLPRIVPSFDGMALVPLLLI